MDKYKIAQEVIEEYDKSNETDLRKYIEEKTKPADPLFEKWKDFCDDYVFEVNATGATLLERFTKFKAVFAQELQGTAALDEFSAWLGSQSDLELPLKVYEKYREVKAKRENEKNIDSDISGIDCEIKVF